MNFEVPLLPYFMRIYSYDIIPSQVVKMVFLMGFLHLFIPSTIFLVQTILRARLQIIGTEYHS